MIASNRAAGWNRRSRPCTIAYSRTACRTVQVDRVLRRVRDPQVEARARRQAQPGDLALCGRHGRRVQLARRGPARCDQVSLPDRAGASRPDPDPTPTGADGTVPSPTVANTTTQSTAIVAIRCNGRRHPPIRYRPLCWPLSARRWLGPLLMHTDNRARDPCCTALRATHNHTTRFQRAQSLWRRRGGTRAGWSKSCKSCSRTKALALCAPANTPWTRPVHAPQPLRCGFGSLCSVA